MTKTDVLARKITRKSSLQTYMIIKLLVDKSLINDAYKAYAYFRWLDDQIDKHIHAFRDRQRLIKRQKEIIAASYTGLKFPKLLYEEQIIHELIKRDIHPNSKLKSYIFKFLSILEFDAKRKNITVSKNKLDWYSKTIGEAVTDCIQYFIGHNNPYPHSPDQYKAAIAAHIVHSLRDLKQDIAEGFINIPKEYIKKHGINQYEFDDEKMVDWIKNRVLLARRYFMEGKIYINKLQVFKCRFAAYLYCFRFEPLLKVIEKENYILRQSYDFPWKERIKKLFKI